MDPLLNRIPIVLSHIPLPSHHRPYGSIISLFNSTHTALLPHHTVSFLTSQKFVSTSQLRNLFSDILVSSGNNGQGSTHAYIRVMVTANDVMAVR